MNLASMSRLLRLLKMKIYRIRDFPESVAIGLAWGTAVSFTPVIGNPWTFPFFFYFAYKFGLIFIFTPLEEYEFSINFLLLNFNKLFLPTLLGSIPIAIIVWFITYKISKFYLEKRFYEKRNTTRGKH